jgi:hypothetical protein
MDKENGVVKRPRAVAPGNRRSISGKGQETLSFFFKTSSHPLVSTQLSVRWVSWAPSHGRGKQLGLEVLQLYTVPRVKIPGCIVYLNSASRIHCGWRDKFSLIEVIIYELNARINFSTEDELVSRYPCTD